MKKKKKFLNRCIKQNNDNNNSESDTKWPVLSGRVKN